MMDLAYLCWLAAGVVLGSIVTAVIVAHNRKRRARNKWIWDHMTEEERQGARRDAELWLGIQ